MTVLYLKRCDSQMWLTKHYMCVITVSYLIIFNNIKTEIAFFLSLFHESLVTANKWHSITEKSQGKTSNDWKKKQCWAVWHTRFFLWMSVVCVSSLETKVWKMGKKQLDLAKSCLSRFNPGSLLLFGGMQKKIKILVIPKIDMHLACSWWETWSFLEEKTGNITFKVHSQLSYWQHLK